MCKEASSCYRKLEGQVGACVELEACEATSSFQLMCNSSRHVGRQFYEFAVEWTPDRINFYTNGVLLFSFTDRELLDKWFNQPMCVYSAFTGSTTRANVPSPCLLSRMSLPSYSSMIR